MSYGKLLVPYTAVAVSLVLALVAVEVAQDASEDTNLVAEAGAVACVESNEARRGINRASEGLRTIFQTLTAEVPPGQVVELAPADRREYVAIVNAERALVYLPPRTCKLLDEAQGD